MSSGKWPHLDEGLGCFLVVAALLLLMWGCQGFPGLK